MVNWYQLKQRGPPTVAKLIGTPHFDKQKCCSGKLYHRIKGGKSINSLSEKDLLNAFEDLQKKLVELYLKEGSFLSPTVLQLSQQLDEYIVLIQKITKTIK
ncbi:aspartyl-phosphate phosphatase Spo0E family protein [Brevibacillus laterosporus]|uniref:aspartyl-phosphate phosphatase Spo0E family protein n=1 Tax=Brevibacillus laterosporus TaxID=1465 RepID=UPI0028007107|nr:aspartyl-phosphate phosphatase Spo0E family protein [Brevibacillus laterosporus]